MLGTGRGGATAADLIRTARFYGLRASGVQAEIEELKYLTSGSILHWEFRHFVVLCQRTSTSVSVMDPASGFRRLTFSEFGKAYTGVALVFEPTSGFVRERYSKPGRERYLTHLLQHRALIARVMLTTITVQVLSAVLPALTGLLVDRVVPDRDTQLLLILAAAYSVIQVVTGGLTYVRARLLTYLRVNVEESVTVSFIDHLLSLPFAYFQRHATGDLMVSLNSNTFIRDIMTSSLMATFLDSITIAIYLVLLLSVSLPLTGIVVLLAAMRVVLLISIRFRQQRILSELLSNQSRAQTLQIEILSGIETLKAMGLESGLASRWSGVFKDGLKLSVQRERLDATFGSWLAGVNTLSTLCLLFLGTYLVIVGYLSLGSMLAFSALATGFLSPVSSLLTSAFQFQMLDVYLDRVNEVMNTPAEVEESLHSLSHFRGNVTIRDLTYRYNEHEAVVLSDISLDIQAGSKVALVGKTGCGKSTLARLIAGLLSPESGEVLFDGAALNTLNKRFTRQKVGYVTQDVHLFSGSIRHNIAIADPRISLGQVLRVAKIACIHEDILNMPMRYETQLADRGMSLSGGQRQRLTIARALAAKPQLLVFDEATSHLDAITERTLNLRLKNTRCTRIVIAHRLSTIVDADQIIVLDGGRIVERGTHAQLVELGGVYRELLDAQVKDNHDV